MKHLLVILSGGLMGIGLVLWLVLPSFANAAALLSTLTDNFNTGTIDGAKWTGQFGTISAATNQLVLTGPLNSTTYAGMDSVSQYDLTGSYAVVQVVSAGNQSIASWEVFPIQLFASGSSANSVKFYINGNTLTAYKVIATAQSSVGSIAYNSSTMQWLRIREASGTTFWDYSADGITWTNLTSVANPITLSSVSVEFSAGKFAAAAATTAIFDNFNVLPSPSSIDDSGDWWLLF